MKKSILSLALAGLLVAPATVFATGSFSDTSKPLTAEEAKKAADDQAAKEKEAKLKADLKKGIKASEFVGASEATSGDVYKYDNNGVIIEIPWVNNKVTLPNGTVIERPEAPEAPEAPKAEDKKAEEKKEAKTVKPAETKKAEKALPKTSAAK